MKRFICRVVGIGIGAIVITAGAFLFWLFDYSGGLPDVKSLAQYAPAQTMSVQDACTGVRSVAISYDSIGTDLRSALSVAEAGKNERGALADLYQSFIDREAPRGVPLSIQISRGMFCTPSKASHRSLDEIRTAVQLERHFSRPELFTIYANRESFGNDLTGVEAASEHFFRRGLASFKLERRL